VENDDWIAPQKSQDARLVDFALGPFMVWFALKATGVPQWARTTMMVSGILTVVYNGANYFAKQEYDAEQQRLALLDESHSDGV
jgi:hypothetical protein